MKTSDIDYDQKVKFPTFDYQGLPILYVLMLLLSVSVLVDGKVIHAPVFFYFLFLLSNVLIGDWWFRKRFIGRMNGENWVIIGHQISDKYVLSQNRYDISDLKFKRINRNRGDNGSIGFVQLFCNGEKILDCPGDKHDISGIIPELFEPKTNKINENFWQEPRKEEMVEVLSDVQQEEKENFWTNIDS
jgi:hypothetical protein